MVPPLVNVLTSVVVSTSLVAAVGVEELTGISERLNLEYAEPVVTIALAATAYLVLNLCGGLLGGSLERKLAIRR
jgi:glutamate transport system permease protein